MIPRVTPGGIEVCGLRLVARAPGCVVLRVQCDVRPLRVEVEGGVISVWPHEGEATTIALGLPGEWVALVEPEKRGALVVLLDTLQIRGRRLRRSAP